MKYLLLWNDDSDSVCGHTDDFETKEDFIEQVKKEFESFDGIKCVVEDIKIEPCISTGIGLPSETLIPLSKTDVEIANYYIARTIELE